jgi:superfamily II DNA/RNA helicase
VAIGDRHMKAVDRITQSVEFLKENEKFQRLVSILQEEEPPIIVRTFAFFLR